MTELAHRMADLLDKAGRHGTRCRQKKICQGLDAKANRSGDGPHAQQCSDKDKYAKWAKDLPSMAGVKLPAANAQACN